LNIHCTSLWVIVCTLSYGHGGTGHVWGASRLVQIVTPSLVPACFGRSSIFLTLQACVVPCCLLNGK
jgi:hypothetical protein